MGCTAGGGHGLDAEGAGHPPLAGVHQGLVVQRFLGSVTGDSGVNLLLGHAFLDIRVVGNGTQGNVGYRLVGETAADSLVGMGKLIIVEEHRH